MFLPYSRQSIDEEDIHAVKDALQGDLITRGPHVTSFEKAVSEYTGANYAVSFNSGSTALAACYWALKVTAADQILTSPNTFIATTAYASSQNAKLKFLDISLDTGSISLESIQDSLRFDSLRGRLIAVPVHFAGIALDMQKLQEKLKGPNVVIIEDAAHAFGSSYVTGEKVGSCAYSDLTIFSFHPAKTLTTGEGGMVTTNDEALYQQLLLYRNNGIVREKPDPWFYEVEQLTTNTHLTDFQAALGLSQLKRIDTFVEKRRELTKHYRTLLKGLPVRLFTDAQDALTAYHLFVVQIDFERHKTTRTEVMNRLKDKGIGSQLHYVPLYKHPVYKNLGEVDCPEMEKYYKTALTLPLYYDLKLEDVERVVKVLKETLKFH